MTVDTVKKTTKNPIQLPTLRLQEKHCSATGLMLKVQLLQLLIMFALLTQ